MVAGQLLGEVEVDQGAARGASQDGEQSDAEDGDGGVL